MKAQIVEQVELFSEAELQSLEFTIEELEAIEQERVPDLDSISFEDVAEDLAAVLERRSLKDVVKDVIRQIVKPRKQVPNLTVTPPTPPPSRPPSPPPYHLLPPSLLLQVPSRSSRRR